MTIKVLYHANCSDGFCAAWLFRMTCDNAEYIPVQYGESPPELIMDDEVYILDFSYPRGKLIEIKNKVKSLLVIDHHKTSMKDCEGLDFCIFDKEHSGAMLTYMYLKDKLPDLRFLKEFVEYIEDRDLWRFELPNSKAVNAAIRSHKQTFEEWHVILEYLDFLYLEGEPILRYRDQLIEQHVNYAYEIEFNGHKGLITLCSVGEIISEVAGQLAEKATFGATYVIKQDGTKIISLRSKGDFDVSELAKQFGGGGHKNAAGFSLKGSPCL